MKYIVDIENDENDDFELKSDNVGSFQIYNQEGENISDQSKATLFLDKNALLGLGTELIRLAHNYGEGKHIHLEPSSKDLLVQRLGVFLTPDSSTLIVGCSDMKSIDDYLNDI